MGGQAVIEGVMMRGEPHVGRRRAHARGRHRDRGPRRARPGRRRWSKIPLVRGVMASPSRWRSASRRSTWSANRQIPEEEQHLREGDGRGRSAVALAFFTAIFIVHPRARANGIGDVLGLDGFWFHVAEGVLRLAIFLGYLLAHRAHEGHQARVPVPRRRAQGDRRVRERRRAHARVGAAVHAPQHVRCGTNFLLTVMVITIVVYSFIGRPALPDPDRSPDRADPGDRRARLRGDPASRPRHMDRALGAGR